MCLLLAAALTAMLLTSIMAPAVSGETVTLEEFSGGISTVVITFDDSNENTSLAIELPRGAQVVRAQMAIEGVPAAYDNVTLWDYDTHRFGADMWCLYMDGLRTYPPEFAPYTTGWAHPDSRALDRIEKSDDDRWEIQTPGESLPPPLEWPVKIFHFRPKAPAGSNLTFSWEGYSSCFANETNEFHAELWLWSHTKRAWTKETEYSDDNRTDVHLNHTFPASSDYVNHNGSLVAAVVGIHAEGRIVVPNPVSDAGHLFTDYVSLSVNASLAPTYPSDVVLQVDDVEVLNRTGVLDTSVTVGDTHGLADTIQAVVDSHQVRPGNITIPLTLRVANIRGGNLRVSNLVVEYQPPSNTAPVWEGPVEVSLDEDSPWTPIIDLDTAFSDDFNQGELIFAVNSVSDPINLSARVSDATGANLLEVLPTVDFFGTAEITVTGRDLFGELSVSPAITVNVEQVPDAPQLQPLDVPPMDEGEELDVTVQVLDPDLPDDDLTFSDSSDLIDIDPTTGRILWIPGPGDVGRHQFTVKVIDAYGLTDELLVQVEVRNVNQAPSIVGTLTLTVDQDQEVEYQVQVDDPDVPFGDVLFYQAFADTIDVDIDSATGLITLVPGNELVPGFEIDLRVQDKLGAFDEAVLVVVVVNVNDAPTIDAPSQIQADQGEPLSLQLVMDDPDLHIPISPEETIVLTHSGPDFLAPDASGLVHIEVVLQAHTGTHVVTFTVTDAAGLSTDLSVTFELADVNVRPVILTDPPYQLEAEEDSLQSLPFEAVDDDGDTLAWSDNTDLFDIDPTTGVIAFTPLQAHVGFYVVTVTVDDGQGGMAAVTFEVVVSNVNDAPLIEYTEPADGDTFEEGELVRLIVSAVDEDGDALTYAWTEGDRELGTGPSVDVKDFGPGKHRIHLVVSDGTDTTETDLTITVKEEEGGMSVATWSFIGGLVVGIIVLVAWLLTFVRRGREGNLKMFV